MYRMIIVDDQIKEINGIKKLFDWKQLDIEIVDYALNGEMGLEKVRQLKPDIVITDVIMPKMDGLKMAEEILAFIPEIKIIFISCFDEFKFVSKAIHQGAYGYVLKPVVFDELLSTIYKVLGVCKEEKSRKIEMVRLKEKLTEKLHILRDNFFRNWYCGVYESENAIRIESKLLDLDIENKWYAVANIELDRDEDQGNPYHAVMLFDKLNNEFTNENFFLVLQDSSHIVALFITDKAEKEACVKGIQQKLSLLLEYVTVKCEIPVTIGLSELTDSPQQIAYSYKQTRTALRDKFYLGKYRIIRTEELTFEKKYTQVDLEEYSNLIKNIIFSGDISLVDRLIERLLSKEEEYINLKYKVYIMINIVQMLLIQVQYSLEQAGYSYVGMIEKIEKVDTYDTLKEWLKETISGIIGFIQKSSMIQNKDIVLKMQEYIEQNYNHQIGVNDVTEYVFLSAGYGNYLFKSVVGETIHQYIESMKMQKVLEMLKCKNTKVFEIAEKLGYSNSAYFINVFKKTYKCTPSEYRKRMA